MFSAVKFGNKSVEIYVTDGPVGEVLQSNINSIFQHNAHSFVLSVY